MSLIEALRSKIAIGRFAFSKHAVDQSILRGILVEEIRDAFASGVVVEDYPQDKYGPSCLILGYTRRGRAIHIQCSHPTRDPVKIITVYEPSPEKWIDDRIRRGDLL